jgi:hypothetical protein
MGLHGLLQGQLFVFVWEDEGWIQLAQDFVQWRGFVVAVLNIRVTLPENWVNLRAIVCEDGRWREMAQDRVQWRALVWAPV